TSYDADNRPLLVMRSNLWASGYDVDGTDQTSLGQFSGRVQQTYKHSVPRFFVPEHGTMFTLALVRFPPTATKEIQYLNAKRSEERFSRNAETDLVCRLLLEKKKIGENGWYPEQTSRGLMQGLRMYLTHLRLRRPP